MRHLRQDQPRDGSHQKGGGIPALCKGNPGAGGADRGPVRKEQRKNGGFHNGYKERKQHPDLADYASMPQEEAILRMQNEILYLHQELDFIKKIIELDRKGEQRP